MPREAALVRAGVLNSVLLSPRGFSLMYGSYVLAIEEIDSAKIVLSSRLKIEQNFCA